MSLTVEKCIEGWTNSLKQLKLKADIVFFGDSLTYYGDFASVFPDKVVCNLGLRGDSLHGMISRVDQIKCMHPDVVFLMAGINDVSRCSVNEFKGCYRELIQALFGLLPNTNIIVQSLLPVNSSGYVISCDNQSIVACNNQIRDLAASFNIKFVDLFSEYEIKGELPDYMTVDGIHLRRECYNKWYELIKV